MEDLMKLDKHEQEEKEGNLSIFPLSRAVLTLIRLLVAIDFLEAEYPEYSKSRNNSDDNFLPLLQQRLSYSFDAVRRQSVQSFQAIYPRRRRSWMMALVSAGLAIVLFSVLSHKSAQGAQSTKPKSLLSSSHQATLAALSTVCIVGNAETSARALSVFNQWGGRFPTVFYVWGEDTHRSIFPPPRNLQYLRAPADLNFAEGMFAAVQAVRTQHSCGYIFSTSSRHFLTRQELRID